MKVPIVENIVPIKTIRRSGVLANTPDAPRVIEAAYGGEIGQAMAGLGKTMMAESEKLMTHIAAMDKQRNEDVGTDLANKRKDDLVMMKHQERIIKDPKTGMETVIGGWSNTQGNNAYGITKAGMEYYDKSELADLETIKNNPYAYRTYTKEMASHKSTYLDSLATHEGSQLRSASKQVRLQSYKLNSDDLMVKSDKERDLAMTLQGDSVVDPNYITSIMRDPSLSFKEKNDIKNNTYFQFFSADVAKTNPDGTPMYDMEKRVNEKVYKWDVRYDAVAKKRLRESKETRTAGELNQAAGLAGEILDAQFNPLRQQEIMQKISMFSSKSKDASAVESAFLRMNNENPTDYRATDFDTQGALKHLTMAADQTIQTLHKLDYANIDQIKEIQSAYIKEYGSGKGVSDPINVYWVMRASAEAAQRNPNVQKAIANTEEMFKSMAKWGPEMTNKAFNNFAKSYDWKSDPNIAAKESVAKAYAETSPHAGKYKVGDTLKRGGVSYIVSSVDSNKIAHWDMEKKK